MTTRIKSAGLASELESHTDYFESPLGWLRLHANDIGLMGVRFVEEQGQANPNLITQTTQSQLQEYFAGDRTSFDLPLAPKGTEFQVEVWRALLDVAAGDTASYADIAKTINRPKAVRAVGAANGQNPIGIIVPCHRIIGSNGKLTGYAFGLDRKAWLLRHEGALLI